MILRAITQLSKVVYQSVGRKQHQQCIGIWSSDHEKKLDMFNHCSGSILMVTQALQPVQ